MCHIHTDRDTLKLVFGVLHVKSLHAIRRYHHSANWSANHLCQSLN